MKHKIILDCDPGVDDAVALMLALGAPETIELAGVTTVAGNVSLDDVTRNARGLLALAGRTDIPVYQGCSRPLMKATGPRASVHGEGGLGNVMLDPSTVPLGDKHAVDFIIETVMANPGEITLCPIGPMTNVALAMVKEPRLAANLREIVFMGGAAFNPGNSTPAAEFNFYVDPHAAQIMISSGAKLTMFGLDVTRNVTADQSWYAQLEAMPGKIAPTMAQMMQVYAKGDPCMHDPCVIAWLIDSSLFSSVDAYVEVDHGPGISFGRSLAYMTEKHRAGRDVNCKIVTQADSRAVFDLIAQRLGSLQPS